MIIGNGMIMWIARDKCGGIYLYKDKPSLWEDGRTFDTESSDIIKLSDYSFPEVTFENSPMEIELKLKK